MTLQQILEMYTNLNYEHDVIIRAQCDFACTFYTLLPQSYFSAVIYVSDTFLVLAFKRRTKIDIMSEVLQSVESLVTDWAIL
jgi:hypothetical protein